MSQPVSQPAQKPPSCSFLLRLLPPSSRYNSPCFGPQASYTQGAQKASFAKLQDHFQVNGYSHFAKLNKCVVKHMPPEDRTPMQALAKSAYDSAKNPPAPHSSAGSTSSSSKTDSKKSPDYARGFSDGARIASGSGGNVGNYYDCGSGV